MNKIEERVEIDNQSESVAILEKQLEPKNVNDNFKDNENIIKRINNVLFILSLVVISVVMCVFIGQKEGWHADEVFSYGSSNYANYNIFLPYSDGKTLSWRTSSEAKDYVTVNSILDIFNYVSVYRNQALDVHPPLFYFLVHTVSILFFGEFTKYTIFLLQLVIMILTCFVIRKIMLVLEKEELVVPTVLLYGLSIGAISTVMLQRMYMLLTLFVLSYLCVNIKILKNGFKLDKKLKKELGFVTILGFLTQYNFCVYALFVAAIMVINMFVNKQKEDAKEYVIFHLKLALIGVLIFPASIYHIFFSYRGISGLTTGAIENIGYFTALKEFVKMLFDSYSMENSVAYLLALLGGLVLLYKYGKYVKNREKPGALRMKALTELLVLPLVFFVIVIAKMSPYIKSRYVMCVFPIIAIIVSLGMSNIIKNIVKNKIFVTALVMTFAILVSCYGLVTKEPEYLYKGYNKYVEIAQMNQHTKFVYIVDNGFTHIKNIKEFMTYDKYLIIDTSTQDLAVLKDNEELNGEKEFILSIKKYMGVEPYLKKVLEYTKAESYEILLDDDSDEGSIIYKVKLG